MNFQDIIDDIITVDDKGILRDFISTEYWSVLKKYLKREEIKLIYEGFMSAESYDDLQSFRKAKNKLGKILDNIQNLTQK